MKNSLITSGPEVTNKLAEGVNKLADLVKITLGPKGKNVIIERNNQPEIVNDGVTIARAVNLEDPIENMGAQVMKQVSLNTDNSAGDGTTTATVLAQVIINKGLEFINNEKFNLVVLKKEMEILGQEICDLLIKKSKKIKSGKDIYNIAKISSNNDIDIANVIAKAYNEVGPKGYIAVRPPKTYEIELEVVKGMVYDRGYLSKLFVNDRKENKAFLKDCMIAMVDGDLSSPNEALALMELAADNQKSLLIIAEKFKTEALNCIISNKMAGFEVCAINSPGISSEHVNFLNDIAAYCGGTVLNEKGGKNIFDELSFEDFGLCEFVEVSMETVILKSKTIDEERMLERVNYIENLKSKTKDKFFLDIYDTRLAKLQGGIAVIFPGGRSDLEITEKTLRTEDAVKAIKSAMEMGFLPGGGSALMQAKIYLIKKTENLVFSSREQEIAYNILLETLRAPFEQIVINCGFEPKDKISFIRSNDFWSGYDAKNDVSADMYKAGIIDATKVTINALQNAISVSTTVLTTEGCILHKKEEEEKHPLFGRM